MLPGIFHGPAVGEFETAESTGSANRRSWFNPGRQPDKPFPPSSPKPSPLPTPSENYILEACPDGEEDCYNLLNVPAEPMSTVDELNAAVNQYRSTHNLNLLFLDPQICELAAKRAPELEADFSHDGFSSHVENGDYDYTGFSVIGENIWMGSMSGVHIVEYGWDRSPGHRENLQGEWSRGCAGIYKTYATYIFVR
jgi:uncharacterized protein YkwD